MNIKYYETKINDCITKAPFESGVEILVYNLLDEILDKESISVIDINRCPEKADSRFCTDGGIPDIAIVSKDFVFKNISQGNVYGLIETKSVGTSIRNTSQISGQRSKAIHYLVTNGIVWHYYFNGVQKWKINICTVDIPYSIECLKIDVDKYYELMKHLSNISWS